MLSKLKLLKTPSGPDTLLMVSGILIAWLANDGPQLQATAGNTSYLFMPQLGWLLAAAVILIAARDAWHPLNWPQPRRTALRVLALSALVVPLCTRAVLFFNNMPDTDIFPWWLLAAGVFWLPGRRRVASAVFALIVLCGLATGVAISSFDQGLWSAWIASYLVYLLYHIVKPEDALA